MPHRISKREWTQRGGLRNSNLFRCQAPDGRWHYFAGATT